ncbi:MAG TPA: hypothetical protein DCL15_06180, partial [Chloroflexi bacterium]|nr:hypothetical protein [Chloroflexota bacterium]
ERIADLVRDGKIEGIGDLRDESDRTGMRIVIELTRTVEPKDVLADLFKYTPLQQTFGMQMLALVDGQPRLLSLKRMLQLFIHHRQEIIRRRSEYELKKARERAHIVEGLLRALDILDEVIQTIRRSQTVETARNNLVNNFKFTEIQAQAILDMQLRRLAALERKKLQEEFNDLKKRIAYLEDLLANPHKVLGVIKDELLAIKAEFGDARRTQIVDRTKGTLTTTDLLPDQLAWVSLSKNGDLRRQAVSKPGIATLRQIGKDSQAALLTANTRDFLYVFSKDGRCSRIGVHEIPEEGGKKVSELTGFMGRDAITAAVALPRERNGDDGGFLFLVTDQGTVKRVAAHDVQANTGSEFTVMNVEEKERLQWVLPTRGNQEVILVSAQGQSIRFSEEEVRSMGLAAGGVGGMKLKKKDRIVYAGVVDPAGELLTVTTAGFGKRSALAEYSVQGRNGGGIVTHKITEKTGEVAAALVLPPKADNAWLIFVTGRGQAKPLLTVEIPAMGRSVQGKVVIELSPQDGLAAIWRPDAGPHSEEPSEEPSPPAQKSAAPATRKPPVTAPLPLRTMATPPQKMAEPSRATTSEQDATRARQAGPATSETESALRASSQPATAKSAPLANRKPPSSESTAAAATPAAAPAGAKKQKQAVETGSSPASSRRQGALDQAAATPPTPTDAGATPLAFDFIDDVAQAPPVKPAATRRKLSAVVSVPNAQAKAAKKAKNNE